jgi:hypothetical protein
MIAALLCFYNEDPDLLRRSVGAVLDAGADGVLAVDGPYELYPHSGKMRSDPECYAAISETAEARGKWWITHSENKPWENSEVGKRSWMMDAAISLKLPRPDWLLVFDSDHFWESDLHLHDLLSECPDDVSFARVSFTEVALDGVPWWEPMRPLVRVRSDLRMGTNHYTYVTDDGISRILERPELGPVMEAFDLTESVHVRHGVYDRDEQSRARQTVYYEQRHRLGIEK